MSSVWVFFLLHSLKFLAALVMVTSSSQEPPKQAVCFPSVKTGLLSGVGGGVGGGVRCELH